MTFEHIPVADGGATPDEAVHSPNSSPQGKAIFDAEALWEFDEELGQLLARFTTRVSLRGLAFMLNAKAAEVFAVLECDVIGERG